MVYRKLGNTGLTVSILGFGTMRLPIARINPNFTKATALIKYALEKGINFFDVGTFYCHHHSEEAFGLATRGLSRKQLIVSGKNSSHQTQNIEWLTQLRHSLALFHRKYFNIYFIHYLKLEQWESYFLENDIINKIRYAKDQGLFHHLGFSSHDKPEHICKLIDTRLFEAVILPFNLLQRDYEETMKYAYNRGLGVIVMNPLAGGVLARSSFFLDKAEEAKKNHRSGELALNFVLSQPFVHSALSGMESENIIEENVRIADIQRLDAEECSRLSERIARRAVIPCTSCNYCYPCTQGINIPEVIRMVNNYSIVKDHHFFYLDYSKLLVTAECCIQCELCVERCPHHIAIPEIMDKADKIIKG